MNKRLWLRNGALFSIPLVLGLVLLRIKLVRDRANAPMQNIVIPRAYRNANGIEGLVFSPDGERLAVADIDNFLQIWSLGQGKLERKFKYPYAKDSMVWCEDNRLIAGGSHSFQVVNLDNEKLELEAPTEWKNHSYQVQQDHYAQCVISPQGTLAALGQIHGAVSVWDTQTGKSLSAFKAPNRETCGLALSADNKTLAIASFLLKQDPHLAKLGYEDTIGIEIAVRDTQTGTLQKTLRWDNAGIQRIINYNGNLGSMGLAFSPDGKLIAGAALTGLSVWNVANGQQLYASKEGSTPRWGGQKWITFSPNGTLIAAIGWGKRIYVWAAKTGELLQEFNGTSYNSAMAFSPDGKRIATGGQDNSGEAVVKIWDVSNMN